MKIEQLIEKGDATAQLVRSALNILMESPYFYKEDDERAVPNYLLILTVAEFLYHGGESSDPPKAAPLLFDEAFYGIDAARRDQLLAFAEDLGLQLFVSSPDHDGVKREIRHSVSLIVVKDENLDVHLSPVTWNNAAVQTGLFDGDAPALGMTVGEETR